MHLYGNVTAYKYSANTIGYYDTLFELTPEHKIPMNLDLNGIQFVDFKYNKDAKKYYAKWGFTRISKLSTDKFMKKGETPKITQ